MEMSCSSSMSDERIKKDLYRNAMGGQWEKVVDIYQKHGAVAHKAQITESGHTAIRLAISQRKEDVVEKLAAAAAKTPGALGVANNDGSTPLHLAAFAGSSNMCQCIAAKDPELIGKRNNDSETPFFDAVHYGHKEAFLCLYRFCREKGYVYGRRGDGETILHTAISRQYYEVAFEIIRLYPKFVHAVNEKGFSPLYLMASTPAAFRSGSHQIRGFHGIIYHCIYVSKLKRRFDYEANKKHQTRIGPILVLRDRIRVLMGCSTDRNSRQLDAEGQRSDHHEQEQAGSSVPKPLLIFKKMLVTISSGLGLVFKAILPILGPGFKPKKIKEIKQKNIWSVQIMKELLEGLARHNYEDNGRNPNPAQDTTKSTVDNSLKENEKNQEKQSKGDNVKGKEERELEIVTKRETPILIAAKNGVIEIVEEVLNYFSMAIHDKNNDHKNVVLLAAENRRPLVYNFLRSKDEMKETIFTVRDNDGNSALHLAAKLGNDLQPWLVPGAALQMQSEMRWYEFVKNSVSPHFFVWFNDKGETPEEMFKESHKDLVKQGGEWLSKTSESFTIVATLIATVAFATSAIVPGGVTDTGTPTLENKPAFSIFAISSLIALCFSITSVIMFLAILTSRYQDVDFGKDLPRKFLLGLTSLFVSIASMLISFCSGHSFVLKEQLRYAALPVYAVTCLAVTIVTIAQFPFYFDLVMITFSKMPWRQN